MLRETETEFPIFDFCKSRNFFAKCRKKPLINKCKRLNLLHMTMYLSKKKTKSLFVTLASLTLLTGASCDGVSASVDSSSGDSSVQENGWGVFTEDDYLKVDGTSVRTQKGEGDPVILRGTNAGGYLVIEQWMTALQGSSQTGYLDHKTVTDIFVERFGEEEMVISGHTTEKTTGPITISKTVRTWE